MRKVKFIYNPNSGEKSIVNNLDSIIGIYQKNNITLIPYRIDKNECIDKAFLDIDDTYEHLLIAGGDGTLDIIVNEMKRLDINLPVGILPVGTANDFAHSLGLEFDIKKAVEKIVSSKPKKFDIGKINDKYFINVASAGMFTDVSQKINPDFKNYMGKVAYYLTGIEEALHLRAFNIKVKSEELEYKGKMYLMMVFNGKTAGNLNLSYKSELDDGYLDVIIFKDMPIQKSIPIFINVLRGEHLENINDEDILYFIGDQVEYDEHGKKYYTITLKSLSMIEAGESGILFSTRVYEDGIIVE